MTGPGEKTLSVPGSSDATAPTLTAKNVTPPSLKGAVSFQDLNKRPTAVPRSMSAGRTLRGGSR